MLQRVDLSATIACTIENHEFGLNEQEASTKILSRHRVEIRYRKVRIVIKIFELHVWIREFGRLEDRNDCSIGVELTDSFRMEEDFIRYPSYPLQGISGFANSSDRRASEALAL